MIINHNIAALNTHRQLGVNNTATGKALEKLSSGLRINRAGDDAAGLAISEKMRGQIRGLEMAQKNAQDGISLIQTAEGALSETHSILQRMRELAVQASNDTNQLSDRKELQKEINQLIDEIDRISSDTEFNTKKLLNGDLATSGSGTTTSGPTFILEGTSLSDGTFAYASNTATSFDVVDSAGGSGVTVDLNQDYGDLDTLIADVQSQLDTATSGGAVSGTYTVEANEAGDGIVITADETFTIANSDESGVTDGASTENTAPPSGTSTGGAVIHIGANSGQSLTVDINQMDSTTLGGGSGTTTSEPTFALEGTSLSDGTFAYASNTATSFDVVDSAGGSGVTVDLNQDYGDLDTLIADVQSQLDTATSGGAVSGTYTVEANEAGDGIIITADETFTIANSDESGVTDGASTEVTGTSDDSGATIGSLKVTDVDSATEGGILTQAGADAAIENIQTAIDQVSSERAKLGAYQNRLEHTINNLGTSAENLTAAESRIRDVDYALAA